MEKKSVVEAQTLEMECNFLICLIFENFFQVLQIFEPNEKINFTDLFVMKKKNENFPKDYVRFQIEYL